MSLQDQMAGTEIIMDREKKQRKQKKERECVWQTTATVYFDGLRSTREELCSKMATDSAVADLSQRKLLPRLSYEPTHTNRQSK